jgi:hypothetical protein
MMRYMPFLLTSVLIMAGCATRRVQPPDQVVGLAKHKLKPEIWAVIIVGNEPYRCRIREYDEKAITVRLEDARRDTQIEWDELAPVERTRVKKLVASSPHAPAFTSQECHQLAGSMTTLRGKAQIVAERKRCIAQLLAIIKSTELRKNNREAVLAAVELLGRLRAEEAAPVLTEMLLFGWRGDITDKNRWGKLPLPPDKATPVVPALARIGTPSLHHVKEKLLSIGQEDANKNTWKLHCLWVIKDILGPELGKAYLENLLKEDKRAKGNEWVKDGLRFMDLCIELPDPPERKKSVR